MQVKNRICHQLPRPVKSNITAAIAFEHFNSPASQEFRRHEHIRGFCITAKRDHWRVLKQKKGIPDASVFP